MKEGNEVIEEDMEDGVKDAALIAVAQRVEHYEMAGYGCVRTYASLLGDTNAAALLEKTLEEEKETDEVLGGIAEEINVEIPRAQNQRAQSRGTGIVKDRRRQPDTWKLAPWGKTLSLGSYYFPDGALLQVFQFGFTE